MKCAKVQELFSGYLENAIEPPIRAAVEQHFSECPLCKAGYERLRAATMLLDELPEMEPPPCFHAAVMARVERARRTTPRPVRWWSIDWQSVFNARVPVRAVAMAAAVLVVLAVLVQLTPLGAITAGLFGGRSDENVRPGGSCSDPTGPLPWSPTHDTQVRFGIPSTGLNIGLTVDSRTEGQVVYRLKFCADSGESIAVEAYVLPANVTEATSDAAKTVADDTGDAVTIVVSGSTKPVVVQVRWTYDGRTRNEFLFLPSRFDRSATSESESVSVPAGTWRVSLSALSAKYGIVIAAPGDIGRKSKAVKVDHGSPDAALHHAILGYGMNVRALASSVYLVQPIR